jgi:hypothetical protein
MATTKRASANSGTMHFQLLDRAGITQVDKLQHGAVSVVSADAVYMGVEKYSEHDGRQIFWHMQPA